MCEFENAMATASSSAFGLDCAVAAADDQSGFEFGETREGGAAFVDACCDCFLRLCCGDGFG